MNAYAIYAGKRFLQFALVVFIGINIAFIVTHATPIDPVGQSIAAATQFGSTSPEAIALMRQSLKELYGLEGDLGGQYLAFWRRVAPNTTHIVKAIFASRPLCGLPALFRA